MTGGVRHGHDRLGHRREPDAENDGLDAGPVFFGGLHQQSNFVRFEFNGFDLGGMSVGAFGLDNLTFETPEPPVPPMPPEPVAFTADRPFILLIRDIPTGAVLFLGRVMNPNK